MNQQTAIKTEAPLLTYDYDSNISQRNMSNLSFLNYYKEPYYHEVGGIITDMYIPTFIHPNHCFVGYNYDEEELAIICSAKDDGIEKEANEDGDILLDKEDILGEQTFMESDKGKIKIYFRFS